MLDQLVESKDTFTGLRTLLMLVVIIMIVATTGAFGKFLWDLREHFNRSEQAFADLKLDEVESPVPVAEDEPPPPEEKVIEKVQQVQQNVDVRKVMMLDTAVSTKIPDTTSTQKNTTKLTRDPLNTVIGNNESDAKVLRTNPNEQASLNKEGVQSSQNKILVEDDDKEPTFEKTPAPTPKPTEKPVPKTVSGGVVNGKARNLVTPQYPSQARAVRASGQVAVAVTIDEKGNVISASAVSGHALLRNAAESAARSSKFNPTLLSGQAVKVTGTIIYNFVP